jgi:branched-chain amino acid transport system substrate-binding protein
MFGKKKWTCTGTDSQSHDPREIDYENSCIDCGASSPPTPPRSSLRVIAPLLAIPIALVGGIILWPKSKPPEPPPPPVSECTRFTPSQGAEHFSLGEKSLFQKPTANAELNQGVVSFSTGNYQEAAKYFNNAITAAQTDPEPRIYKNNALARQTTQTAPELCPLTIAVVVPSQGKASNTTSAEEILRGVADVQEEFNTRQTVGDRLLEILIVNDKNDQNQSWLVAEEISKNNHILAVIGHNSSESSKQALPIYNQVKLPMISPTSTDKHLSQTENPQQNTVFFRTVPSDALTAPVLADYIQNTLGAREILIFSDSRSNYSQSILEELRKSLDPNQVKINNTIALDMPDLKIKEIINNTIKRNPDLQTIVLLPSTESTSTALRIIKEIKASNSQINFVGGDALYTPTTLQQGGQAVEDLVLVVPIIPTDAYAQEAEANWGGRVNWRTVAAYDAAQALVQAIEKHGLKESIGRQDIIKTLNSITLKTKASEESWNFINGDRQSSPCLVKATPKAPAPQGVLFGFKVLQCKLKT